MTRIAIASSGRPDDTSNSAAVASRWVTRLTELGHTVAMVPLDEADGEFSPETASTLDNSDVLIAVHSRRSADIAEWWRAQAGPRPVIVGLTGPDLAIDMPSDATAMANTADADAIIVLHPQALERVHALEPRWADKTHVVHPSVDQPLPARQIPFDEFRVVVLADLESSHDPLVTARAASLLPPKSRVAVHHGGRATDNDWLLQASAEAGSNPRYVWHGELNRPAELELLASAYVLACTSIAEGGTTLVTEAIAMGVPVIATRTERNVGLLGADHPGLFTPGDHLGLATMLDWLELSPTAQADLAARSLERQHLTSPDSERTAFKALLRSLTT